MKDLTASTPYNPSFKARKSLKHSFSRIGRKVLLKRADNPSIEIVDWPNPNNEALKLARGIVDALAERLPRQDKGDNDQVG